MTDNQPHPGFDDKITEAGVQCIYPFPHAIIQESGILVSGIAPPEWNLCNLRNM